MEHTEDYKRVQRWAERIMGIPFHSGSVLFGLALSLAYILLGEWSYQFVLSPEPNAIFWLPSGLTVYSMTVLRWKKHLWPFVLIPLFFGELLLVLRHEVPVLVSVLWSLANVLLGLTFAFLTRRFLQRGPRLTVVKDLLIFFTLIPFGVIPSGVLAAFAIFLGFGHSFVASCLNWALSDALGIILLAPALFAWTSVRTKVSGSPREALVLAGALIVLSCLVLVKSDYHVIERSHFSFLIFFAAWAAIRFGARGVTVVLLLIDFLEVWASAHGFGTFTNLDLAPGQRILTLQLLVANVAAMMLILAAALEEQRALREGAEDATRMRDEFISIASHELKTPLTSLTMELQMLNRFITTGKLSEIPQERLQRLAKISEREIQRFGRLINDLLDVSRISSGKLDLVPESVDLLELVNEAVYRFESETRNSGSVVTVTGVSGVIGHWDRARLDQVLTNLLSNAIKYGQGRPIDIEVSSRDRRGILVVRDHGLGVSEEDQERIFQRFERAVSSRELGGLGLGLFITQQIVKNHGGVITLESSPGKGASFRVELPFEIPLLSQKTSFLGAGAPVTP